MKPNEFRCPDCKGQGEHVNVDDREIVECITCHGTGKVEPPACPSGEGANCAVCNDECKVEPPVNKPNEFKCPDCKGTGLKIGTHTACLRCNGSGKVEPPAELFICPKAHEKAKECEGCPGKHNEPHAHTKECIRYRAYSTCYSCIPYIPEVKKAEVQGVKPNPIPICSRNDCRGIDCPIYGTCANCPCNKFHTPPAVEGGEMSIFDLREYLWFNHGCPSQNLYGDDGKMDCNKCVIDFRNTDIRELIQSLLACTRENAVREEREKIYKEIIAEFEYTKIFDIVHDDIMFGIKKVFDKLSGSK